MYRSAGFITLLAGLLMPAFFFPACGDYKRGIPSKAPAQDDTFQTAVLEETSGGCTAGDDGCAYARAVFPQFVTPDADFLNPVITGTLNDPEFQSAVAGAPADSVTAGFKRFIAGWESFKQDFPDETAAWFRDAAVVSNRPFKGWITLEYTLVEFQGGAHEKKITGLQNWDLAAKRMATLGDLMKPGYEAALRTKLEQAFRSSRNLAATDSLKKAGLFEETWQLPRGFQLRTDGIRFFYNPYEIGAWSAGPVDLLLTWDDLGDLAAVKPQ